MTEREQIAEMAVIGCVRNPQAHTTEECLKCDFKQGMCNAYRHAETLYNAGYRKTFTSDLASDTQKAFKDGYSKGVDYGIEFGKVLLYKTRKETAKEILNRINEYNLDYNWDLKEEFKKLCKDYDVEVEDD